MSWPSSKTCSLSGSFRAPEESSGEQLLSVIELCELIVEDAILTMNAVFKIGVEKEAMKR